MRDGANILLVDDRPENLTALEAILEPLGERLVLARSGDEALRAVLRHEFAAILLDVQMPGLDGYETAALIKSRERSRHVPIIFLTAVDSDDRAARRGYGAGAVDYLFKPFDPVVLRSKVSVFIDLFHLKREAEDAAHRALHDPLTGLPNRVLFRDRLGLALARTRRLPSSVGVFYVDLDGFKPVNDILGHGAGDALLSELAQRLRAGLRPDDTVARLGGDEFAVLSDSIDDEVGAADIAGRIIAAASEPFEFGDATIQVSASVGIALGEDAVDSEQLLREADEAMYAAKAAGGAGWRLHGPSRSAAELRPVLVPRLGGVDRFGVEVVEPDGTRVDVDALSADAGARLLAAAVQAADGASVSVPVPPAMAARLDTAVQAVLTETGTSPASLCVEVPDCVLRDAGGSVLGALRAVSALGVRLAVRDYGESGASPATLARLPLSALVLDPRLDDGAARATVALAHGLAALAVGIAVDDADRLDHVRAQGCDVAQGAACGERVPLVVE